MQYINTCHWLTTINLNDSIRIDSMSHLKLSRPTNLILCGYICLHLPVFLNPNYFSKYILTFGKPYIYIYTHICIPMFYNSWVSGHTLSLCYLFNRELHGSGNRCCLYGHALHHNAINPINSK